MAIVGKTFRLMLSFLGRGREGAFAEVSHMARPIVEATDDAHSLVNTLRGSTDASVIQHGSCLDLWNPFANDVELVRDVDNCRQ